MSLEQALADLAAAIREQTAAVLNDRAAHATPRAISTGGERIDPAAEADASAGKKAAAKVTAKPAPAPTKAAAKSDDGYAPVKAAILAAIGAGHRKSVTDLLAEYDAKTGQDLTPEAYSEVLEKLEVITNGGVEDLA